MKVGRKKGPLGTRTSRLMLLAQLDPEKAKAEFLAAYRKACGRKEEAVQALGLRRGSWRSYAEILGATAEAAEIEEKLRARGKYWTMTRDTTGLGLGRPVGAKDSKPRRKAAA